MMFARFYNAALWGMFLSVLLFQNTWLEMRINLGFVFFALVLVLFVAQVFIRPLRRLCGNPAVATFSLIVVTIVCWLMLGTERVKIIPASILREGLMMPRLSFSLINFMMEAFITLGWMLIEFLYRGHERS